MKALTIDHLEIRGITRGVCPRCDELVYTHDHEGAVSVGDVCTCDEVDPAMLDRARELDWRFMPYPEPGVSLADGAVTRVDRPSITDRPHYVVWDGGATRRIPDAYRPWQLPVSVPAGGPTMTFEQFYVARRLASTHGHGWADILRRWEGIGGRVDLLEFRGLIPANAVAELVSRYPEWHHELGPGIDAPDVVFGNVVHRSVGGRIGWEVAPNGDARLTVYRRRADWDSSDTDPLGDIVLIATVPYGSDDVHVTVVGDAEERHHEAMARMVRAVVPKGGDEKWMSSRKSSSK